MASGEEAKGKHTVYILRCGDGSLYTGWTTRLEARIKTHNQGKGAKYTRTRLPVELVYAECWPEKSQALRREHAIKALSRAQKLSLISGQQK
ncbi:GIY-YIG nuclease family protein [Oscillospiraceae bacterium MB08-C2-2]|nr:GIY-YIG nuclease family protein [Oscillospiraceae bacterium MB08-C2-2]